MTAAALAAALLAGGAQTASAQATQGGGQPADPPIVAYRKAVMNTNVQHLAALRALLGGDLNLPDQVRRHARALADNGRLMESQTTSGIPDMFPAGSTHARSRATAAIWEDKDGFAARVRAFREATRVLDQAAQGGVKAEIEAALSQVQPTCAACHTAFRGPAPAGD